ncbi:MAG: hypothetical protein AAF548_12535 [Actinomycetota bacterium]
MHVRRLLGLVAVAAVLATCADDAEQAADPEPFAPPPGGVWQESDDCDGAAFEEFEEARRDLWRVTVPTPWAEVESRWMRWERAAEGLRGAADIDDGSLDDVLEALAIGRRSLAGAWGDEGAGLEIGRRPGQSVVHRAFPEGAALADGTSLAGGADGVVRVVESALRAACIRPPAGWEAMEGDDDMALPAGRVFMMDLESLAEPVVVELPTAEPIPWEGGTASYATSSPDNERLLWGRQPGVYISDVEGGGEELVGGFAGCWSWSQDSRSLIRVRDGQAVRLELETRSEEPVALDPRETCLVDAGADRYVTTDLGEEPGTMELWVGDATGSVENRLLTAACTLIVDTPHPQPGVAAVVARCADTYQDGLWLVDVETGEVDHVVTGVVGTQPSYSPDGRWVAVTRISITGDSADPSVWIVDLETRRERQLSRDGFSFPALIVDVPDGSPG